MGVYYDVINHTKKHTLCGHGNCFKTKPPSFIELTEFMNDADIKWDKTDIIEAWSCETMYVYDFNKFERVEDNDRFIRYMESEEGTEPSTRNYKTTDTIMRRMIPQDE